MVEPEWTRVRPSLRQKSMLQQMLSIRECVCTDMGCLDPFLVWVELGRTTIESV